MVLSKDDFLTIYIFDLSEKAFEKA